MQDVRAAAERLLADCQRAGSTLGFTYEQEDLGDIRLVAQFALDAASATDRQEIARLRILIERALPLLESEWIGPDGPILYPDSGGEWIVDARAALAASTAARPEAERLRDAWAAASQMVYEHHSAGVMDGVFAGQPCPVCADPRLAETKTRMRAPAEQED